MEIDLTIHREPWVGTYLRVRVTMPDGETATSDLPVTELKYALDNIRDDD